MAASERLVRVGDLVGAAEIAERLGLAHVQTVHTWRRRNIGFPEPLTVVSRVAIWSWPDVREWGEATGRIRPGRRQ